MVPRDLKPQDRVEFCNSRATRVMSARVTHVTFSHVVVEEVKTRRVRAFRYDDPHVRVVARTVTP